MVLSKKKESQEKGIGLSMRHSLKVFHMHKKSIFFRFTAANSEGNLVHYNTHLFRRWSRLPHGRIGRLYIRAFRTVQLEACHLVHGTNLKSVDGILTFLRAFLVDAGVPQGAVFVRVEVDGILSQRLDAAHGTFEEGIDIGWIHAGRECRRFLRADSHGRTAR